MVKQYVSRVIPAVVGTIEGVVELLKPDFGPLAVRFAIRVRGGGEYFRIAGGAVVDGKAGIRLNGFGIVFLANGEPKGSGDQGDRRKKKFS